MSIIVQMGCSECGENFPLNLDEYRAMGMAALPKSCPQCLDVLQERPDVTILRREVVSILCRISSLPGEWQRVERPNDYPGWRMIVKGSRLGASWSGRIDLWTVEHDPPNIGDVVCLKEMEVIKRVAKVAWSRATLEHGIVGGYRQVPLGTKEAEVFEETRRYVRLDTVPGRDTDAELIWVMAHTKTTLKGYGRQYHARLDGNPLWHKEVSGGVRSGRKGTQAWLAVIDQDHPVIRIKWEDGKETKDFIFAEIGVLEEV